MPQHLACIPGDQASHTHLTGNECRGDPPQLWPRGTAHVTGDGPGDEGGELPPLSPLRCSGHGCRWGLMSPQVV